MLFPPPLHRLRQLNQHGLAETPYTTRVKPCFARLLTYSISFSSTAHPHVYNPPTPARPSHNHDNYLYPERHTTDKRDQK